MEHVYPLFSSNEGYISDQLRGLSGEYGFRIQNPHLFTDYSIENGIVVVYWRGGEW